MSYQDKKIMSLVLKRISEFRETELLTDITLETENKKFKAHKVILSAASDYFRAMFTDPMLESKSNEISLSLLTAEALEVILDYIYTSEIDLCIENAFDVLQAASYLQIQPAIIYCEFFIKTSIDNDNVIDVVHIAEMYCLQDLKENAYEHIAENFKKVGETKEFHKFTPEQMEHLLSKDLVTDCLESETLALVLKWFLSGEGEEIDDRITKAEAILSHIHFFEITKDNLNKILADLFPGEISNNAYILKEILVKQFSLPKNMINPYSPYKPECVRGMDKALVIVGGFGRNGITNNIMYSIKSEKDWHYLTKIPHVDQCNFGATVYNNNLYIVGGCFNQSLQEVVHPFGFKYNPRLNKWQTIEPMSRGRCRFTLNVLENYLYAIGGSTEVDIGMELGFDGTSSCERYNIETNGWEKIKSLPEYRSQHAAATHKIEGHEYLYVSGGLQKGEVTNTLYYYDPQIDRWEEKSNMPTARADHSMFEHEGKLYVCGGWRSVPGLYDVRQRNLISTIDMYDPKVDTWETVAWNRKPRFHCAIIKDEGRIYFVGGFLNDALFYKNTGNTECYDLSAKKWTIGDKAPQEFWEHSGATLFVPRYKRYRLVKAHRYSRAW